MRKRITRLHSWYLGLGDIGLGDIGLGDKGQASTEYALVLLGAAVIALLVVGWATSGGGGGKIGRLFEAVLDEVISRVG